MGLSPGLLSQQHANSCPRSHRQVPKVAQRKLGSEMHCAAHSVKARGLQGPLAGRREQQLGCGEGRARQGARGLASRAQLRVWGCRRQGREGGRHRHGQWEQGYSPRTTAEMHEPLTVNAGRAPGTPRFGGIPHRLLVNYYGKTCCPQRGHLLTRGVCAGVSDARETAHPLPKHTPPTPPPPPPRTRRHAQTEGQAAAQ